MFSRLKKYMGQVAQHPCGNCGTLNSPNDQFCANCGYLLAGGPTGTIPALSNAPSFAAAGSRRITGSLATGMMLGGRYSIVQVVGKGGFGAVYKVADERFKSRRTVAIKEMSDAHLLASDRVKALEDFRQEADLLVQLKHPNLPDVSDFFEEGGKAYLVMEFIEGKTLEKAQDEAGGPLDEKLVMGWALQLCDVLHYLHTQPQPIIFRDLKPSNVMVTRNGQIKLIDFGIARIFKSTAAKDTTTLGSRGYAPLEQYGRGQSDPRSDIYALGATLYDLLTHEVPADAPTRRVNPLTFVKPRQLNPAISIETERIVLKAMAEEPKDRYQSATEMFQDVVASGIASGPLAGTLYPTSPQPTSSGGSHSQTIPATQVSPASQQAFQTIPAPSTPPVLSTNMPAQASQQRQQVFVSPNPTPPATYPPGPSAPPGSLPSSPAFPGSASSGQRGISRRNVLIGGVIAAGALLGGGYAASRFLFTGGQGSPAGTIQLNIAYSTEKAQWLQAAVAAFNNSSQATLESLGKTIQPVLLDNSGSLDIGDKILSGAVTPVIWSPASRLELNRLNYQWMKAHNSQEIIPASTDLAPQSLVQSPIALAVWQTRADALRAKASVIDWDSVHMAVMGKGWSDFGHPDWGHITLGQTYPYLSNSGLLAITLMAYAYAQKTNGPQFLSASYINNNPGLWNYIQVFENAVGGFGQSSETYFTGTILPEGHNHSITITYENLVLLYQHQAMQSGGEPLEIFYPSQEAVSDHPFAVLDAPWVSDEQKSAAKQFRQFLLSHDQQIQALKYGFRPSDLSISLTDSSVPNNPFNSLNGLAPASKFDPQKNATVTTPNGDVVEALIKQWQQHFPGV